MCVGPHDFIPAPNTAKLEMIYSEFGQRIENVLHIRKIGGWTSETLLDLANAAQQAWTTNLRPAQAGDVTIQLIRATDVSVENGPGVEIGDISPNGGLLQSPGLPTGTTVATKFSTGLTGRSNRGRAFWVGLVEEDVTGNQISGVVQTRINQAWNNFFTDLVGLVPGAQHVVVSYCNNKAWRTTAAVNTVLSYSTDLDVDSMRRRLTGRGQ